MSNLSVAGNQITTIDNEIVQNEININNKLAKTKIRHIISASIKRGIDLVAGIVGCILLIPITLFVVFCNAIFKDNGPIFFSQERIGKNGKSFKMYKFRTMVVGAEEILQKHIDEQTEIGKEYIEHKKIKNDPRITKIGKFLRATSLDEFPQFMNVIKGQMSLVGPRPYLLMEKEDMGEYYDYIVQMKPGVTGPWQVAGRNNLEFNDRLELDKEYCDRRGNRRDIKIVFKTIMKVVKKEGAI
ncbi:MAG: sugar transferase [Clostridia bacterium]|nr:sugar transferase [Clostridia bacterium]